MPSWQRLWSALRRRAGPLLILYTLARVLLHPEQAAQSLLPLDHQLPAYLLLLYIPNLVILCYLTVRRPAPPLVTALAGALLGWGLLFTFGSAWVSQPQLMALLYWLPAAAGFWATPWPLAHPWPVLLWPLPLLALPFGPLALASLGGALAIGLAWRFDQPGQPGFARELRVSLWFHGAAAIAFASSLVIDQSMQGLSLLYGVVALGNLAKALVGQLRSLSRASAPVAATAETNFAPTSQATPWPTLSEHLPDALIVIDQHQRVQEANLAARRLFALADLPSPLLAALATANFHDSSGRPLRPEAFPGLLALKGERVDRLVAARPEGPLTRWYELSAYPITQNGQPPQALVSCHEVTQERQLEKALARRATELEMIFQEVPVGIALYDGNGELVRENRLAAHFAAAGMRALQAPLLALALRGQPALKEEYQLEPFGGAERSVHLSALPLAYSSGQIEGVLVLYEEITLFRQLEKAKNEFLSLVAHELRNPLATLTAAAELAERLLARHLSLLPEGLQRVEPLLGAISDQGHYLGELLTEMLDAAQLGAGRLTVEPEPTDLIALCQEMVTARQAVSERHRLTFTTALEPPLIGQVDPKRFRQVLGNLLDNATKYSPAGGLIEVTLAKTEQEILLEVQDQGLGIAPADLPHLFDGFYRGRRGRQAQHLPGLGLGLPVSRDLVRLHGGDLVIESELGVGTRATVSLPLTHHTAAVDPPVTVPLA